MSACRRLVTHGRVAVCALMLMLPAPVPAQTAVSSRPAVGPEARFTPPPRAERTLPNGLRVIAVRFGSVPKTSVVLTLRSGLANEPVEKAGLAQFVADAVQEGTASRDGVALRRDVFAMGATLGASVSLDATSFSMRGLSSSLGRMLGLLGEMVREPSFPQKELDLLLSTAAQRLQGQLASPQFVANRAFRGALFGPHPYASIGATPASIRSIDRVSIAGFHRAHYVPRNAFLLVVSDLPSDAVFAAAERSFAAWSGGAAPEPTLPPIPSASGRRLVFVQRPNSVQSSIVVGQVSLPRADPRWLALQMANQLYGGAFDSRLVRNIREQKGYTYSPQSQFAAFEHAGFYRAAADVRNEVTGATLTEIFKEIDGLRDSGPAAAELAGGKTYMRGLFAIQNATQGGLVGTLNTQYTYGLPSDYLETYQARAGGLSPEAVATGARMLLPSADAVVVVVGDYTKVKDQLTGFRDITFVDITGAPIPPPQ